MSNASTVYDTVISVMGTLFPSKTRIPNPYLIEENPDGMLRDGFGVAVGSLENPEFEFNRTLKTREYIIPLSKQLFRLDIDTSVLDTTTKLLLEEVKTIQSRFEQSDQIGVESSIENIEMGGGGPVEFLEGDNEKFLTTTISINISFSEDIGA